ncbi:MAG: DUF1800 domain-containing protein [Chloroflexi bacterium]|nr:DUF1800 domain-containing protein [Chloroflexota bacterium]
MSTALDQRTPPSTTASRRSALAAGLAATLSLLAGAQSHAAASGESEIPISNPRLRIAHLLRRAGFGATKELLDQFEPLGYEATVDYLVNYEHIEDPIEERLAALPLDLAKGEDLRRWWYVRMAHTNRPLQEKMTLFWHGLLTSALSKVPAPLMLRQNQFLREHAMGSFRQLLQGISTDAAMLIWLDGRSNRREHPNENYARELMELFTMGIGHYTEQDVREAARAFTGWTATREGEVRFVPRLHDSGVKTFLGRTGRFGAEEIVDILVAQRATGEYIGRRLFSFFAYRNPEREIVQELADVYFLSGYSIKDVVRHILLSDAFSSARAYRSQVRSPVELVISVHRLLGLETDGASLPYRSRLMGQDLFNPPNVAGWPGGAAWLNSSTWIQRVNFVNAVASQRRATAPGYLDLAQLVESHGITQPQELVQLLIDHLLDGNLSPEARAVVESYLASGQTFTLAPASLNRKGRTLVYLLLASPEFQLI